MDKEKKIDAMLACLASMMEDQAVENEMPTVAFLSGIEVQICSQPGNIPTNKVYESNPIKEAITFILDMFLDNEYRHWSEEPELAEKEDDKYDPNLCPDHALHRFYYLGTLIDYPNLPK